MCLVSHSCNRLWISKTCFVFSCFHPETKVLKTVAVFSLAYCCVVGLRRPKNLCKLIFSCNSPKRVFYYISQNRGSSILFWKCFEYFSEMWEYYLVWAERANEIWVSSHFIGSASWLLLIFFPNDKILLVVMCWKTEDVNSLYFCRNISVKQKGSHRTEHLPLPVVSRKSCQIPS